MLAVGIPTVNALTKTSITDLNQIAGSGTYILTENMELNIAGSDPYLTIDPSWDVEIDLNGKTVNITGTGASKAITNDGKLTISDNAGGGSMTTETASLIRNQGTASLTVNGGTLKTTNTGGSVLLNISAEADLVVNSGVADARSYAVYNNGTCTINGGTFKSVSDSSTDSFWGYTVKNFNMMVINNATVTGIQGAVASSSGNIKIYDGDFSTDPTKTSSFYALYIAGEEDVVSGEVYGGTFYSPKYAVLIGNDNTGGDGGINADATTSIYGGTFTGDLGAVKYSENTGKNPYILGGTFNSDVSAYLSDEACQIQNEDGTYIVGKKATGINLSADSYSLATGTTFNLTGSLTPSDAINSITWQSSDSSVASVDSAGTVTAKSAGTATITATADQVNATCTVTVYKVDPVLPDIDTGKPQSGIKVGMQGEASKAVLNDTLNAVLNGSFESYTSRDTYDKIQQAIANGETINIQVSAKAVDKSRISAEDIEKINTEIKALDKVGNDTTLLQYLDLNILIAADSGQLGKLSALNAEVSFAVLLPENMSTYGRAFNVIRIHDGEVTVLPVEVKDGVCYFTTDRFSTYALVYSDIVKTEQVDTGDVSDMGLWIMIAVIAVSGAAILYRKRKNYR